MRRTINISVSEEMHGYILGQSKYGSVSEYIRGLVRREQQWRADYAARPSPGPTRANDWGVFVDALDQLSTGRVEADLSGQIHRLPRADGL